MKIISFVYYRLRKMEFANYVRGIMTIIKKYDTTALGIGTMVAYVFGKLELVSNLKLEGSAHPLTPKIDKLREQRNSTLSAINYQLWSFRFAGMSSLEAHVSLVQLHVDMIMKAIRQVNEKERRERLFQLFALEDNDAKLKEAFAALNLGVFMGEVRQLQEEIETLCAIRVKENSLISREQTVALKREISTALDTLYRRIEMGVIETPEQDFQPLISEINTYGVEFRAMLKGRNTRSSKSTGSENEVRNTKETVALSTITTATA